jgi:hypothetical protein
MQIIRIFIITTIIAFVPVLALPVGVESQELVAREPSVGDFFKGVGAKIKNAFQTLGKKIRSIGRRKQKKPVTPPPVETRELGVVYAREDADALYIRGLDDEIYAREFDDEFEAREFEDEFEAREFEDEFEAREFDDEFEAREFDDELAAREHTHHQHPRELSYDILD